MRVETFSLRCHVLGCSQREKWGVLTAIIIFEYDKCICEILELGRKFLHRHPYSLCMCDTMNQTPSYWSSAVSHHSILFGIGGASPPSPPPSPPPPAPPPPPPTPLSPSQFWRFPVCLSWSCANFFPLSLSVLPDGVGFLWLWQRNRHIQTHQWPLVLQVWRAR